METAALSCRRLSPMAPPRRAVIGWRCIYLGLLAGLTLTVAAAAQKPLVYLFTLAPRYDPDAWMSGGERFPLGAAVYVVSGRDRRRIAPDLAWSADASVSYDGNRVLFSGKLTQAEPWQIWETSVSGSTPREITKCDTDCTRPLYLPEGRIVYTRRVGLKSVLEVVGSDGGVAERLTFAPGLYFTDDVLQDGRILVEVVLLEKGQQRRELYTIFPDGSGIESLRCDHGHDRSEGRQVASGDVIFQSDKRLARIRSGFTSQTELPQLGPGVLAPVAEVAPERWILSSRGPADRHFSLYIWEGSRKRLLRLEAPADAVQPAIVAARTPPREFPSRLHTSFRAANVLGVQTRQSIEPYAGVAKWVRVYSEGPKGTPEAVGRAPVGEDGSFFLQVAGDRPLRFELLDYEGRTLRSERNWIWLRIGEQRICVGCHAGPTVAPENQLPDALRGRPVPAVLHSEP